MSQISELNASYSTMILPQSGDPHSRLVTLNKNLPEIRHVEKVVRAMLRRRRSADDPLVDRILQAADVVGTALARTESVLLAPSIASAEETCPERPDRSSGQGLAFRLARRILRRMSRTGGRNPDSLS